MIAESEQESQKREMLRDISFIQKRICPHVNENTIYGIYLPRLCAAEFGEIENDTLNIDTEKSDALERLLELREELVGVIQKYLKYVDK